VYYGAARTEAAGTRGQDIHLIGGGNSAGQAAMFFANYARTVTLLVRGPSLAATMSHYLIEQLASKENVSVLTRQQVVSVEGETRLEAIVLEDRGTGRGGACRRPRSSRSSAPMPRPAGCRPRSSRDERGYVCTGRDVLDLVARNAGEWPLARDPYLLETSVPGSSPPATCVTARSSASLRAWARAAWPSPSCHQYLAEPRTGRAATAASPSTRATAPA
jgi:thioredoxin reductase (NADPH)